MGDPMVESERKKILKAARHMINKLARNDKSAIEALEYMCSYNNYIQGVSAERVLPIMREKQIRGKFLGMMWDIAEKDFSLFVGVVVAIPKDLCSMVNLAEEFGFGFPTMLSELILKIVNGVKVHRDEFDASH